MSEPEIFEPFDKLITLTICGQPRRVPENNTILRGLQFLEMEAISYGEFCWNGDCLNCKVTIRIEGKDRTVIACRTNVYPEMEIVGISDEIAAEFPL